jgi:hypothetical protein
MSKAVRAKRPSVIAGARFLAGALAFAAAGVLGGQVAFYGVAAAFAGVGCAFIAKARKAR